MNRCSPPIYISELFAGPFQRGIDVQIGGKKLFLSAKYTMAATCLWINKINVLKHEQFYNPSWNKYFAQNIKKKECYQL